VGGFFRGIDIVMEAGPTLKFRVQYPFNGEVQPYDSTSFIRVLAIFPYSTCGPADLSALQECISSADATKPIKYGFHTVN